MREQAGYLVVLPWESDVIGGVNQVVANLYDEMSVDTTFTPYIFIATWNAKIPVESVENGKNIIRGRLRPLFEKNHRIKSSLAFLLFAPLEMYRLAKLIKKKNIRIINAHFPSHSVTLFILMRKIRLINARLVLSLHGSDIRNALLTAGPELWWWRVLYRYSDALVVCSDELTAQVENLDPLLASKVTVVHNGIDASLLSAIKNDDYVMPAEATGKRIVLSVGTFEHQKGQDVLIQAIPYVLSVHPDVIVVLVGRPGAQSKETGRLIQNCGLHGNVIMIERLSHPNVLALLDRASILVLPSRNEAFSVVLLEAGAFALPVVATNVCGVKELIAHEEHGLVVPSEDSVALGAAINRLLDDKSFADRLGSSLHKRVTKQFTRQNTYMRYKELSQKLLSTNDAI